MKKKDLVTSINSHFDRVCGFSGLSSVGLQCSGGQSSAFIGFLVPGVVGNPLAADWDARRAGPGPLSISMWSQGPSLTLSLRSIKTARLLPWQQKRP